MTAPVETVGVRANGDMDVPRDPAILGWWQGSAKPRQTTGQIVIAGHVFNKGYGKGAFYRLKDLSPGEPVTVVGPDGAQAAYTVTDVEYFPKSAFPADLIFGQQTAHRLVLVTCGGTFDRSTGHYLSNVVAFADPL